MVGARVGCGGGELPQSKPLVSEDDGDGEARPNERAGPAPSPVLCDEQTHNPGAS